MPTSTLTAAILVVSTTAAQDASSDSSGPALNQIFEREGSGKWEVIETKIVGDDVRDIQRTIMGWTDSEDAPNVVISTGGTGFSINDHTPEAVTPLLHKQAPGLVHGMLAASLAVTPCEYT
jgi:gephyrin